MRRRRAAIDIPDSRQQVARPRQGNGDEHQERGRPRPAPGALLDGAQGLARSHEGTAHQPYGKQRLATNHRGTEFIEEIDLGAS